MRTSDFPDTLRGSQRHTREFVVPEAFEGLFTRTDRHSTEADLFQKCSKEILQTHIVVDH